MSRKQKKIFDSTSTILNSTKPVSDSFNEKKIFKNLFTRKSNTATSNKNLSKGISLNVYLFFDYCVPI